ncbi:MAG: hypothetical protein ACTFAK_13910 [Candidatus Electronema sp. VV]
MKNNEKFNCIMQVSSFAVLLLGSLFFGLLGKTTEMGLAILAGCLSLAFANLDKISKFKGAGFEAEMRGEEVAAMIAKDTEPPRDQDSSLFTIRAYSLDDTAKQVVKSLGDSKYTWRSLNGISNESNLPASDVREKLNWLKINGLAIQPGISHQDNWGLTEEGRNLFNSIFPPNIV